MLLRSNSTLLRSKLSDGAEMKTKNHFCRLLPSTWLGFCGHFPMVSQDESHLTLPRVTWTFLHMKT